MMSVQMTNYMNALKAGQNHDINEIITSLYKIELNTKIELSESQVEFLIDECRKILLTQPTLLELEAPVAVSGDIHGQYGDLIKIFEEIGYPPDFNYLFLGNYIDRGNKQVECICLLIAYKIKFPENFFLLRGNHETEDVNRMHGFFDECKKKYNVEIWKKFNDLFNCLPLAAVIEDKIFCCHGGPSPDLYSFKQILRIRRPIKVPETGLICHLLWAEPDEDVEMWGESYSETGITFGRKALTKFLKQHHLDLLCRSQLVQDGYQFFAGKLLVSIFSASNFAEEFENAAATMIVEDDLKINFRVFIKLKTGQEIVTAHQLDQVNTEVIIKPLYKSKNLFIKEAPKEVSRLTPKPSNISAQKSFVQGTSKTAPTNIDNSKK